MTPLTPGLRVAAAIAALAAIAGAQCANTWVAGSGLPTNDSTLVSSLVVWDADGAGPQPAVLVAGGPFTIPGPTPIEHLAIRDLATGAWSPFPGWTYGRVTALAVTSSNGLVAASAPSIGVGATIARWTGSAWVPFGTANDFVFALAAASNDDLFAGGIFTFVNSQLLVGIARWNGSQWHSVGGGLGGFSFAAALALLPNGNLVVGGYFSSAGSIPAANIARWDGTSWSAMPGVNAGVVQAFAITPNGDLLAAGSFGGVRRWNGSSWSALGASPWFGSPSATATLAVLPDGGVLAGGSYAQAPAQNPLLRWNGSTWSPAAPGHTAQSPNVNCAVSGLAWLPNGDLAVGGNFGFAGGQPSAGVSVLTTTCPPSITAVGASCASSGGSNTLTASLPWAGSEWRATGSGLPVPAFVFAVTGLAPAALPLGFLPHPAPNCSLLVQPDLLQLVVSMNGFAEAGWTIPATPAVVGVVFRHQMVSLEFDAALQIVASTATNAVELVIGSF